MPLLAAGCIPILSDNPNEDSPPAQSGTRSATADGFAFAGDDGAEVMRLPCDRARGHLPVTVAGAPVEGSSNDIRINADNGSGFAIPVRGTPQGRTTGIIALDGAYQQPFATASVLRVALGSLDPSPRFLPVMSKAQLLLSTCP